jgi:DNA-binding transcriptional MocR family regulator
MTKKKVLMEKLLISIINGMYRDGDKLPSLRKFANLNDASLYTTLNVYNELTSFGVIESRPKKGYFVAKSDYETLYNLSRSLIGFLPAQQMIRYHYDKRDLEAFAYDQYIDRVNCAPTESCFQLSWSGISDEYFSGVTFGSIQSPERLKEIQDLLASRIALWMLSCGCHFMTKHITVTNSAAEALMFAIRACHHTSMQDDYVLGIESPGSMLFAYCARILAIDYREIRSDPSSGLCAEDLACQIESGTKFSAILLSSCNADPTGAVMPECNKKRLVELCQKHQIPLIEYDEYGHFCFSRHRHPPIKVLDHEMVIYVSDFSKVFGDSFPFGFVESGQYTKMLRFQKSLSGSRVPMNMQVALSELLDTENIAGSIEKSRERIDRTVKMFMEIVRGIVPGAVRIWSSQGSPFLWVELPGGVKSMREFLSLALSQNVLIAPGQLFTTLPEYGRCFRVNCCTSKKSRQIAAGAKALGNVIAAFLES